MTYFYSDVGSFAASIGAKADVVLYQIRKLCQTVEAFASITKAPAVVVEWAKVAAVRVYCLTTPQSDNKGTAGELDMLVGRYLVLHIGDFPELSKLGYGSMEGYAKLKDDSLLMVEEVPDVFKKAFGEDV